MTGVQYSGVYFSTAVMAVTKHMWVELHFADVDLTKHKCRLKHVRIDGSSLT